MSKDYPCDRVLMDIFQLALEMQSAGFDVRLSLSRDDYGRHLCVDIWADESNDKCYGTKETNDETEAVISSSFSRGGIGNCTFDYDDFDCLHKLYDAMRSLLIERNGKTEVNF